MRDAESLRTFGVFAYLAFLLTRPHVHAIFNAGQENRKAAKINCRVGELMFP
jgi:hypothetical protein